MNKPVVLVIDDEPQIQKLLQINLENNGYKVHYAMTGKEGLLLAANQIPDVILLDLNLPDIHGHQLLLELREWYNKAIIILSVLNSEENIVKALDNGATDYLTKPFRSGELLARIRSVIRRNSLDESSSVLQIGDIEIDLIAHVAKLNNEVLKLTATEYNLLVLFAKNEGRVLTHQQLLKDVWGVGNQNDTQYLRVFVAQLRKKIEKDPNQPKHIITESGVGYRFQ
ncbi:MAG TPA: response regulator transcription factor [Taishania sp.]|nr:response regulator transcription factor [Taishania sp.]HNS41142.1 response regulator transcription factor [Taishania sp.]